VAIAPLQLPGAFQSPQVDLYGGLSQLGEVFKKSQQQAKLSDLGKQLASGSVDYRQAAGQVADMGDITHTLQFLALAEQQKKQALEQASAANFATGLGGLYGAQPTAAPSTPNPMPEPGRPAPSAPMNVPAASPPMAMDRVPVASTAKVWGDAEAEAAGIYEPKAGKIYRNDEPSPLDPPAVRVASLAPQTATDARPAPAAPPAAVVSQAQPQPAAAPPGAPQVGAQHVPVLLRAMSDPNMPAGQKETAKLLLTEAFKNMKEPEKIQTLRAMKADPSLLEVEKDLRRASKTDVNIDTQGGTAFAKAGGTAIAKRFEKLSEEGDTATTDLAMIGQLRDLGAVVKTGAPAAIQGWLAERGIKVGDNVGAVEAYGSIIDKLTPSQRIPGSGATSDYEGKMFKNSLPKLINTPEGNQIIETTLAGLAQSKIERAKIAEEALSGEIKPAEAMKKMRDLPNPYDNFKKFAQTGFRADPNNPASTTPPKEGAAKPMKFTAPEIDQSLSNARARIARDPASRETVIKTLRENGLPTDGL
jgi:hypothetical protein